MRQLRVLGQGVWYEVRTHINNREPLFRHAKALALFTTVFHETELLFVFEVCGLRLEMTGWCFTSGRRTGLNCKSLFQNRARLAHSRLVLEQAQTS
jgi:hypothetical protein